MAAELVREAVSEYAWKRILTWWVAVRALASELEASGIDATALLATSRFTLFVRQESDA